MNLNNITWNIEKAIKNWINKATDYLLEKVKEKSPEDTKEYIKWHKIEKATNYWNRIKWSVYNDMEYAQEVEYWFRKSPVNWSKQNGDFLIRWVWARVYTRTGDQEEKTIKDLINKEINNAIK